MHSTTAQNRAHRHDLVWAKIGRSEYMRGDGVTIRKDDNSGRWWIYLPTGERAAHPWHGGGFSDDIPATGHSLTWAKLEAERITADSPAYTPRQRRR